MTTVIEKIQRTLSTELQAVSAGAFRPFLAGGALGQLHQTMAKLTPQFRYWLKTGWVAANKIISLQIPERYAIVRGKVGMTVEFGLNWGITRLRGGVLLATLATDKRELHDSKFAVRAAKDHIARFGKAPRANAYDRGGWSEPNVKELKRLGVRDIGLSPCGRARWLVTDKVMKAQNKDTGSSKVETVVKDKKLRGEP